MDNIKQSSISKNRSYTACLSAAHGMMFDNIRTIFCRTWTYCLSLALISAIYVSLYLHAMLYGCSTGLTVTLCITTLITLAVQIACQAKVISLVNGQSMKWNVTRCTNIAVCSIAFCVMLALIYTFVTYSVVIYKQPMTISVRDMQPLFYVLGAMSIIIMLILLPFTFVVMKYLMEPEIRLRKIIFKSYKTGLRHWGLIFTALFLATLCTTICALFISIPMLIILAANSLSVYGVNFIGDPTGLPSYFTAIQLAVFTLTFFIWQYVNIFITFVCYFLYGSIITREKEKNNLKKEIKDQKVTI